MEFVREMIKNSKAKEPLIFQENKISKDSDSKKNLTQTSQIQTRVREIKPRMPFGQSQNRYMIKNRNSFSQFPEPTLPPRLQYLQPIPKDEDIDLGKINILLRDPAVKTIECRGPEEKLIVTGSMGIKPTSIILSLNEINETLERFSTKAKIPLQEGIFKIVFGRLILNAIISEVVAPKFLIKKMSYPLPNPQIQNAR